MSKTGSFPSKASHRALVVIHLSRCILLKFPTIAQNLPERTCYRFELVAGFYSRKARVFFIFLWKSSQLLPPISRFTEDLAKK